MSNDNNDERWKPWPNFSPGRLKAEIDEAWNSRPAGCDTAVVAIIVNGNNPITGYAVELKPAD